MNLSGYRKWAGALLCVVLAGPLLSACSSNADDLNAYIAEVQARPPEPIPPIPPVKTYTPYVYEGQTGRDPFRPSTSEGNDDAKVVATGSGPQPNFDRPKEYLEQYELDTLAMVGTFAMGESEWALVRDPDGVVHRVAVGNYIGRNHGKITLIEETQLELSELITDGLGGWLVREASMAVESG
jgi:type IV pilus assembly protein PilP